MHRSNEMPGNVADIHVQCTGGNSPCFFKKPHFRNLLLPLTYQLWMLTISQQQATCTQQILGTVQVRKDLRRSLAQPPAQHTVGFEIEPSYSGLYAVPHASSCLQQGRILLWQSSALFDFHCSLSVAEF